MAQTAQLNININSKQAEDNVNKLSQSINNAGGSAESLRLQLRKITQELQTLEPGSARFQELSARAGQLRDQIADTNAVINATAGNLTENFARALTSSIQLGVAGFQGLLSVQTLFGVQNEDLQRSLAQFGALLNLTQAIETFGGLNDRLVEIRAGFTPLLQQLGLMAVAQTEVAVTSTAAAGGIQAEGTAATGAAASTTLFGAALNALPIIAIVTGIGLLVAGLVKYSNSNSEAAKNEKIRVATLKQQREEEEKQRKAVAGESAEFVLLIGRLKETNAGSKERKDLIKQINADYGTTLKNLSDEASFQNQLNLEVANYIAYQKAKYQLQKNEDAVIRNLGKQDEINTKLAKARANLRREEEKFRNLPPDAMESGRIQQSIKDYNFEIQKLEGELAKAEKRLASYYKVESDANDVIMELTDNGKKYGDQTNKNTEDQKDSNDETERYASLLENVKNKLERQLKAEDELKNAQIDRITNAQEREIATLEKQFGDQRQELIDGAIAREIAAFEEKFKTQGKSQADYEKGIAEIKANAEKNLLDSEKTLLEERKKLLDEDINNIKIKYENQRQVNLQGIKTIQTETKLLELEFAKQQEIDAINQSVMTEEAKQKAILDVKRKYIDEEVRLLQQQAQNQINALTIARDQQLQNQELTSEERKLIEEKYNQDVLKINQDTQKKIQDAQDGTKQSQETQIESLTKLVDKVSQYVEKASEIWSQFSDLISQRTEQEFAAREAQIENVYNTEMEALQNSLDNQLISREQYDDKVAQLNQQRDQRDRQLARQKFEEQKKLQIVNATIQGITATLAAYSSGAATPIIGVATGPVYAAIAAAFAAAQVAMIANQQFTAAGGGIVPGIGSGMVDSVPSLLAPGETVINAQSSAMYPELLNSINQAGGGISLKPDLPGSNKVNPNVQVFGDNRTNSPIKAYVVESEVTDTQKRISRIKRSAEF